MFVFYILIKFIFIPYFFKTIIEQYFPALNEM